MEYQSDIGSTRNVKNPKCSIASHQSAATVGVPNKGNNIAIFNFVDVKKVFVEIEKIRYPKISVNINYAANDYLDQYGDFKHFIKN